MFNLFPKQRTPYYIWSPPYTHTSSGVRTLHLLCHALNQSGQVAYIVPNSHTGFSINPELNTPVLSVQQQNFYGNDFIAVYSDIVHGNPFGAKHIVRYLLAPAGAYGGDSVFPAANNVWGALPSISDKVLRIPVSDPEIFYPPKFELPRKLTCFYAWKYENHGNCKLLAMPPGCVRLQGSLEEVASILRQSITCYVYEVSSIMTEAALCGCPVTLMRTPYFSKIDPECMMGNVRWSDGESVRVCNDYYVEYRKFIHDFWDKGIHKFIEDTQGMI